MNLKIIETCDVFIKKKKIQEKYLMLLIVKNANTALAPKFIIYFCYRAEGGRQIRMDHGNAA